VTENVLLDTQGDVVVLVENFKQRKLVVDISVCWLEPRAVDLLLLEENCDLFPLARVGVQKPLVELASGTNQEMARNVYATHLA
jgi:hypothetical protein